MSLESEADRLEYLRTFGLCLQSDRGQIQGLFDRVADVASIGEASIVASGPVALVRTSDAIRLALKRGDALRVEDVAYVIRDVRPDGQGMTTLGLDEA